MAFSLESIVTFSQDNINPNYQQKPDSKNFRQQRLREVFSIYRLLDSTFTDLVVKNGRYPNARDLQLAAKVRTSIKVMLSDATSFLQLYYCQKGQSAQNFFAAQGLPWLACLSDGTDNDDSIVEPSECSVPYETSHAYSAPCLVEEVSAADNVSSQATTERVESEPEQALRRPTGEGDCRTLEEGENGREVSKAQPCEPDCLTLNERCRRDTEKRISSHIETYFSLHGVLPKLACVCKQLKCSQNTARPILARYTTDHPPTPDLLVVRDSTITTRKTINKPVQSEKFTQQDQSVIDNCFAVVRELVETRGKCCYLVTLNVPSTGNEAEIAVARAAKKVVANFTASMTNAFGVLHYLSGWERQVKYRNRLHLHTLFVVEPYSPLPTHDELTSLWSAALPSAAFVDDSGGPCYFKPADIDVRWHLDFSERDKYEHCYVAKIKSKKARFINGVPSLPKCWWHADSDLINCANSAVVKHEMGALREHHASRVVGDLIKAVEPESWQEVSNRKREPYRKVTGYQARFPAHQLPEITADISAFADEVASRPYALEKNAARIFALVTINPSGLVTVTTRRQEASLNVRSQPPMAARRTSQASSTTVGSRPP